MYLVTFKKYMLQGTSFKLTHLQWERFTPWMFLFGVQVFTTLFQPKNVEGNQANLIWHVLENVSTYEHVTGYILEGLSFPHKIFLLVQFLVSKCCIGGHFVNGQVKHGLLRNRLGAWCQEGCLSSIVHNVKCYMHHCSYKFTTAMGIESQIRWQSSKLASLLLSDML